MTGALRNGVWALLRRGRKTPLSPWACAPRKGRKDTQQEGDCLQARRRALTRSPICLHGDRGFLSLRLWDVSVCRLSHPVCDIFFYFPKLTENHARGIKGEERIGSTGTWGRNAVLTFLAKTGKKSNADVSCSLQFYTIAFV